MASSQSLAEKGRENSISSAKLKAYHFVSTWKLEAPLDTTFKVMVNSFEWHKWWKSIEQVTHKYSGTKDSIGNIRSYTIKSPLGYKLNFDLKLTKLVYGKLLEGNASGDLVGTGVWYFKEDHNITYITCVWDVKTTIKWMNTFRFILAPVLRWNHAQVMKKGAKGLARRLDCKLIAD